MNIQGTFSEHSVNELDWVFNNVGHNIQGIRHTPSGQQLVKHLGNIPGTFREHSVPRWWRWPLRRAGRQFGATFCSSEHSGNIQ
jgi:hypothetical protein